MPTNPEPLPTDQTLWGSRSITGINRTGLMYGNPISSYDMNSMQNNLLNLLAGYASSSSGSTASIDLGPWIIREGSSGIDRDHTVYNIRATINIPDRGETYFIYCPSVELNWYARTELKRDQYLRIWYRVVAYVANAQDTRYTQTSDRLPVTDKIFRYGYVNSTSTVTQPEEIPNDIADNQMDSEVSVRLGLEWTLSFDGDGKKPGFTEGPIVALLRWKATNFRFLFNTTRHLAYNTNLTDVPTFYAQSNGSYVILDGAYDMLMSSDDSSVFLAQVVFDKPFQIGTTKHIVIGVKDAPDIILEYRLADGTVVASGSKWKPGRWEANKPYLMHFSGGVASYTDPSEVVPRTLRYRYYSYAGYESERSPSISLRPSSQTKTFDADFRLDPSSGKFKCIPDRVYNLDGIDHYYTGSAWKTCVPAGVVVGRPRHWHTTDVLKGFACCNGAKYSKTDFPELFHALGEIFGSTSTTFNVPNYDDHYIRGYAKTNSLTTWEGGEDTKVLGISNIPKMTYTIKEQILTTGNSSRTYSSVPEGTVSDVSNLRCSIKGNNTVLQNVVLNHSHHSGVTNDSKADPRNPVISSNFTKSNWNGFPTNDSSAKKDWPMASLPLKSHAKIASEENNDAVYMGCTSIGKSSGTSPITSAIEGDVKGTAKVSFGSNINLEHTHNVTVPSQTISVGTELSSPSSFKIQPKYAYMALYVSMGRSLVVEDDMVYETISTAPGNIYSAPTVSAELYARTVGSANSEETEG